MSKPNITSTWIALKLQELLDSRSVNQARLARELSINKSTLHGWINGVMPKQLGALIKIARHFNISLDQLCVGDLVTHAENDKITVFVSKSDIEAMKRIINSAR